MAAVTNKVFKGGESWLTKERQKFENLAEENFQKFSTECQQEVDWLRNYLQDIISRATKVEASKKGETFNQETTTSTCNNVEINTNANQQIRKLAIKHTPKSKHDKPEIKSLILAAAAAKRVNSKLVDLFYKANVKRLICRVLIGTRKTRKKDYKSKRMGDSTSTRERKGAL
jgi:hypothetical protein